MFSGGEKLEYENIFPGIRIQREILTDFWVLQLQRIDDSSIFWAQISDSGREWKGGFG